jgi:hypothetical protein
MKNVPEGNCIGFVADVVVGLASTVGLSPYIALVV